MNASLYAFIASLMMITVLAQADTHDDQRMEIGTASTLDFRAFDLGSFEKIVEAKRKQNHLVVLWSLDCPPCIKELQKISDLHRQFPEYQLTLINTDTLENQGKAKEILQLYNLLDLENWGFTQTDAEKLRYDIDPRWFGDLPRSYFFPIQGKIKRLRGALSSTELLELFEPS